MSAKKTPIKEKRSSAVVNNKSRRTVRPLTAKARSPVKGQSPDKANSKKKLDQNQSLPDLANESTHSVKQISWKDETVSLTENSITEPQNPLDQALEKLECMKLKLLERVEVPAITVKERATRHMKMNKYKSK